jgi:hypothetical protein
MSEELQVFDLPFHPASHITTDELLPGDDLQSNLLVRHTMNSQLHLAKRAFSQRPHDMVGADALLRLLLRCRLNRFVPVAILFSPCAGIWRFVLCSAICRWGQRDLELAIFVGAVRHHRGVESCFWVRRRRDRGPHQTVWV